MTEFLSFFAVLVAALLFSTLFKKFSVPWVVALIIGGIIIGPSGINFLPITPEIDFLGQMGLVFLMFMAGLETKLSRVESTGRDSLTIPLLNGFVPMAVGASIALWFGHGLATAAIVGIVFMSSSIVASLPSFEANKLIETDVGATAVASTMLQDILALLILAGLLQFVDPTTALSLPIFFTLLMGSLFLMWWAIPRLKWIFIIEEEMADRFEGELRMVVVILLGIVTFFELIGVHSIVAGFLAGLMLSEVITNEELITKLHAISYGLFIPIFFILTGMKTDLGVFMESASALSLTVAIVLGSVLAKYLSGLIAARLEGFSPGESSVIASTSIPQLSTTLAVVFIGAETGLLTSSLTTALIALSIVTTLTGPVLIDLTLKWMSDEAEEEMRER